MYLTYHEGKSVGAERFIRTLKDKIFISLQMNFIGRLLENLRDEKFIRHLETIFEVLI